MRHSSKRTWAELTWTELRDLDRPRIVAILPCGATEAHGPHLPLATDVIIAEAMAEAGARRLEEEGWTPFVLPPVAYTAAPFAAGFPGTVSLRPELVQGLVVDVGRSLATQGVACLAIANAHLDPAHVGCLRSAVAELRQTTSLAVAFPDITRRALAGSLTEEFRSGACHAGQYEGSLVLAARPDLVRREEAEKLPPNPSSLSVAIGEGKATFQEAGGAEAYFGDPAAATAAEGKETLETLAEMLSRSVLEALGR